MAENILYFDAPAALFEEALPLGNGKTGAMIYGGVRAEKMDLNYDELWTGFPRDENRPGAADAYRRAKKLALAGELLAAQQVIEEEIASKNVASYLPAGALLLTRDIADAVADYKRILRLDDACATVSYREGGAAYLCEYFTSAPKDCLIIRYSSDCKNKISFSAKLDVEMKHTCGASDGTYYLDGECPFDSLPNREKFPAERGRLYADAPEERGICYRIAIKTICKGGVCAVNADGIRVQNADEVILILACESSFHGYNRRPFLDGKEFREAALRKVRTAAEQTYEKLLAEHISDYRQYYDRVTFALDGADKSALPTDRRLFAFMEDKSDAGLYTLLFHYGRYLTICASRPGSQAMNLQGIWNNQMDPPWNADYTVNINTEMNYFPTLMCDLAEMHLPLIALTQELAERGRETARNYYDAGGFCVHHNTDLWRACQPVNGCAQWLFWPMAGGWLCHHLYEHYEYTCDEDYLKQTALPVMLSAAEFYLDVLSEDENGYLIFAPSTSPENKYLIGDKECDVSETTCMTMSIIAELFANTLQASAVAKLENAVTERIRIALPRLLPIRVGTDGRIMEWYREAPDAEPHHRHVSHLYGLHPARLITPERTPELAQAAIKTLEARGDEGTGWSLGWKINFWARLLDGNHALKLLDMQLRPAIQPDQTAKKHGGGTYPNLFDAHPPFQIDGNFGATAGMAEMLLQSDAETIWLLPALPDAWRSGQVTGLRAKGGAKVDITWRDGHLVDYTVSGGKPMKIVKCR